MTALLLNDTPVLLQSGSTKTACHGELFFAMFKSVATSHCTDVFPDVVKCLTSDTEVVKRRSGTVGSILVGVLDAVGRDVHQRHK